MIKAIIIEKILRAVSKKFKLDKVLKYVEDPNDADERIDKLETIVFQQGRLIEFILKEKKNGVFNEKNKKSSKKDKG
tara:strand:+ start:792 stop:1022 length:231 start_codon:yes stop_codon:yes gene_type:complete